VEATADRRTAQEQYHCIADGLNSPVIPAKAGMTIM
jgi:hypothetical protein